MAIKDGVHNPDTIEKTEEHRKDRVVNLEQRRDGSSDPDELEEEPIVTFKTWVVVIV